MSRKVSCTVTVGQTSERHNHDLDYRETLEHVHGSKEAVVGASAVAVVEVVVGVSAVVTVVIDEVKVVLAVVGTFRL